MNRGIYIIMCVALAVVFAGCKVKQKAVQEQPAAQTTRTEIEIPCQDKALDDKDYYRATGSAININLQNARLAALQNAKALIHEKLGGFISGVTTEYTRNVASNTRNSDVQTLVDGKLSTAVDKAINDAEVTCEKIYPMDDGNYECWVAIQIPKKMLVESMLTALDGSDGLDFDADQFRKYAEETLNK